MYGNGGIKCWDRDAVLDMKTHENAETDNAKVPSRLLLGFRLCTVKRLHEYC